MRGWAWMLAAVLGLAGCAAPARPPAVAPVVTLGERIEFGGLAFEVERVGRTSHLSNWLGQSVACSEMCTVVFVTFTNKTGAPLPFQFQPVFRLVDASGARYEPHTMHMNHVNMNRPGRPTPGQSYNPNVAYTQALVFEAPEVRMQLQVMVPAEVRHRVPGGMASVGPFFLVNLQGQAE